VLPLTPYPCKKKLFCLFMRPVHSTGIAEFFEFQAIRSLLFVFSCLVIAIFAFLTNQRDVISCHNPSTNMFNVNKMRGEVLEHSIFASSILSYSIISETVPAPTVLPPSRIAKRKPFSIAIGAINSISNCELSPGITISTPSANVATPVTSVVRK
jgi:hypothetical protein